MVRKIIKTGDEAREQLVEGAKYIAEAVGSTLGPWGQNFFLDKKNAITNDGVTIAREIQLNDEVQQRGVVAIREASIKTNDEVGDATTTAVVLAYEIYKAISDYLPKKGVASTGKTPTDLIRQVNKEFEEVVVKLNDMKKDIESEEELINSAIVSVEDRDLGALIGKAQWALGPDGVLIAEKTANSESRVEPIPGIIIDNGFCSSWAINNAEKQTLDLEDTYVFLTSYTIKTLDDWLNIINIANMVADSGGKQLAVFARAWTDETVGYAATNIQKKGLPIYPINAPYEDMAERFRDIEAIVGGHYYDSEGPSLADAMPSDLGYAKKLEIGRYESKIAGIDDDKSKDRITNRVATLKEKMTGSVSDFEKKNLTKRIAQLQGGMAAIKIGSTSEMERNRLYDKAEDAVNAVRVAFQEGTVPGAGLAFKTIADTLPDTYILKKPLASIYDKIKKSAPQGWQVEDWVRDPVKVLRVALKNACTAAASFATAGGVITNELPKGLNEVFQKQLAQTQNENN